MITGRILLDVSLAFKTQRVQTEILISSPNWLFLPHSISVCVTIILPHVLLRNLEDILDSSSLSPPWSHQSFSTMTSSSKYPLNGSVLSVPLPIPCANHYPLLPGSVQFSSVTQSCPTLCDPMDYSTPGFRVLHHLLELAQTQVH